MSMDEVRIQIIIQVLGLIIVLALMIWAFILYQRWFNRKMYNLGDKIHSNFIANRKKNTNDEGKDGDKK